MSASNDFRGACDQFLAPNWLLQHFESTKVQNRGLNKSVRIRRNHQKRNRTLLASQLNQEIDSSFTRHPIVADDEIEVVCADRFERSVHVFCRLDRVALSLQHFLNRVSAGPNVVSD